MMTKMSTQKATRITEEMGALDTIIKALQSLTDDQRRRIMGAARAFFDGLEHEDGEGGSREDD